MEYTIDSWHTMYYAAGYLFEQVNPRIAAICHYEMGGGATDAESIAEIRSHWKGLFMWGGPDVQVLNVTKDAIWTREASLPEGVAVASMDPRVMIPPGVPMPDKIEIPRPKIPREEQQEQFLRDMEIDPDLYYPDDVNRPITQTWPEEGFFVDPKELLKAKGIDIDEDEGDG
jgi:ribonuclease Z